VGFGWNWLCGWMIEINSCNGSGSTRPASIKTMATGVNNLLRNNAGVIDRQEEMLSQNSTLCHHFFLQLYFFSLTHLINQMHILFQVKLTASVHPD